MSLIFGTFYERSEKSRMDPLTSNALVVSPLTERYSRDGFTGVMWDRDGHLSGSEHFFLGDQHVRLMQLQK